MTITTEVDKLFDVDDAERQHAYATAYEQTFEESDIDVPLHVWESGFEQGAASDEEVATLAERITGGDVEALYKYLDGRLLEHYAAALAEL